MVTRAARKLSQVQRSLPLGRGLAVARSGVACAYGLHDFAAALAGCGKARVLLAVFGAGASERISFRVYSE